MDALYDDLSRMFGYINFSNAKGCYADDITVADLRENYAKLASPSLIAKFLHHYSITHPELVEECVTYSEELPRTTVLCRLRSHAACPDQAKLTLLLDSMRSQMPDQPVH